MLNKVLIANRGEIACRIIKTLRRLNISSVAIYSIHDRYSLHVKEADEAYLLKGTTTKESYLNAEQILQIAKNCGADGIHPGYGFLSENANFAELCETAGIAFCGPTAEQIRLFGLKHTARELAQKSNTPLLPGTGLLNSLTDALTAANEIGFPVMLKSTAGGGGIGMRLSSDEHALQKDFETVIALSQSHFGESGVFLEKAITRARHIEVQIFGNGKGRVWVLGERDCSLQRRNQKVVEETPAPGIANLTRQTLHEAAKKLAESVNYRSAGTVEFLYDVESNQAYFLEMNTRLQVEHPVTECVFGLDLVEAMLRLAGDDHQYELQFDRQPVGAAIEVRLYAEDPARNFRPDCGTITAWEIDDELRCDTWIETGTEISSYYDPLLAKLIAHGTDREEAIAKLRRGLQKLKLGGISNNLAYLQSIVSSADFATGGLTTDYLSKFNFQPPQVEVLVAGMQTTVQDSPGRLGYWNVGVPPSGPMDQLSFEMGNQLLGNPKGAAGLECTLVGPTLKFYHDTAICLTGALTAATLDNKPVDFWKILHVKAGQVLKVGECVDAGQRCYILFNGGLNIPLYLGSASTFILGKFGGHAGRVLQIGDVLAWHVASLPEEAAAIDPSARPSITHDWEIGVKSGPHGAPDFFTSNYIETFFATSWEVHFNSARTGVRLIGPKPLWARKDGGDAGLHPSNIHDNAYAVGAVDFTGDMPVILGPDGPSLGGFVCPVTLVKNELWKLGQLRPGDHIRFVLIQENGAVLSPKIFAEIPSPILGYIEAGDSSPSVTYRRAGDCYILIEYGEMVLDLALRMRVQVLYDKLSKEQIPGILEMTPGIRSLQIHYDTFLKVDALLQILQKVERQIPNTSALQVPTRIVHLPLAWDDDSTRLAIKRYMSSVNPDAPWCPDNIEFIRRINGLNTKQDVKDIVFGASYLVMGLGDVYLGAPVATPLDPRHRLVTTKYNPARTWTPENAVGIGGAYLCIYGMEGPGGYQFIGRTLPVWNRYRQTSDFREGKPWLLRFFDQIRFYPVKTDDLPQMREDFIEGKFQLKIEHDTFCFGEYLKFLEGNKPAIETFRNQQKQAFEEERERWAKAGIDLLSAKETQIDDFTVEKIENVVPDGCDAISATMPGSIWKLQCSMPANVRAGDTLAVIESMKMEVPVVAPCDCTIVKILIQEQQSIKSGQALFYYRCS